MLKLTTKFCVNLLRTPCELAKQIDAYIAKTSSPHNHITYDGDNLIIETDNVDNISTLINIFIHDSSDLVYSTNLEHFPLQWTAR